MFDKFSVEPKKEESSQFQEKRYVYAKVKSNHRGRKKK